MSTRFLPLRSLLCAIWLAVVFLSSLAYDNLVLGQISEVSSPELIERLKSEDVDRRRDAVYELVRRGERSDVLAQAFAPLVSDRDNQVRFQALLGLARMGADAAPATQALIDQLGDRDDQIRFRAGDALGKIGQAALPALLEAWPKASAQGRIAIAQACGEMQAVAAEVVPQLLSAALEKNGDLPRHAATALVRIAPSDEALAVKLAQHPRAEVRQIGISALAAIPAPQEQTIVQLQTAVRDDEAKIRETALIALAKSRLPSDVKAAQIEQSLLDSSESVRAAALVAIRRAGLFHDAFAVACAKRLEAADGDQAKAIIRALAVVGPAARGTFPQVVDAAETRSLDPALVAETLAAFGEAVVPQLLGAIESRPGLEPLLSTALAKLGDPAMPALLEAVQSEVHLIRMAATRAISELPTLNDQLRQVLIARLADEAPQVRSMALSALINRTSDTPELRGMVAQAMEDENSGVRKVAYSAVGKLAFPKDQLQLMIATGLQHEDPLVIAQCLESLAGMPDQLLAQRERVVDLIHSDRPELRLSAVRTIGKLDKDQVVEAVVEGIATALTDSDKAVQLAATETIRDLGLKHELLVERVAANLTNDVELLRESLETIATFGGQSDLLVQIVTNILQHERSDVRSAAVKAIAAIDQQVDRKVEVLRTVLDDAEWEVRRLAGIELGKLGPQARAAVPRLLTLLSHSEDSDYANNSLREIDTAPIEAIPMLIASLGSEDRRVNFYAVTLLGKIGPEAAEALPKLDEMLKNARGGGDNRDFRRKFLREAIQAIRGDQDSGNAKEDS
jgi:HEAT repeat protein